MKAHLINTHLLVPWSNIKILFLKKWPVRSGALGFHKHILVVFFFGDKSWYDVTIVVVFYSSDEGKKEGGIFGALGLVQKKTVTTSKY